MTREEINAWAKEFAADLDVGGERVPLDRVIAAHLPSIVKLREAKLTWRAISAILTRGGARRNDGQPISLDQFRADAARLIRRLRAAASPSPPAETNAPLVTYPKRAASKPARKIPSTDPHRVVAAMPAAKTSSPFPSKEVSSDDVVAAMASIRK